MNLATRASNPLLKAMIRLAISLNVFIQFKNKSALMWVTNRFVARLFNPTFMTRFTTTTGSTVYFPDEEEVLRYQESYGKIMAHEFVHIQDRRRVGYLVFTLGYMFPQVLALPAAIHMGIGLLCGALMPSRLSAWIAAIVGALLATVLGAVFIGGWTLYLAAFLVFLAPLPAPWRTKWEIRGYTMNMALDFWKHGSIHPDTINWITTHFTGSNYYFMWPFKAGIKDRLTMAALRVTRGSILADPTFREVCDASQEPTNPGPVS